MKKERRTRQPERQTDALVIKGKTTTNRDSAVVGNEWMSGMILNERGCGEGRGAGMGMGREKCKGESQVPFIVVHCCGCVLTVLEVIYIV